MAVSFGARADSDYADLRAAIEKNWNLPLGLTGVERHTVSLRLHLTAEGVVTQIEVLEAKKDDPTFRALAESARRAVLMTQHEHGRLPLRPEEVAPTIVVRWPMKQICEERGGC